jgi:hypothetical protein
MKRIALLIIFLIPNIFLFSQYNLETCTTDIADDVPDFFKKYFHCVKARMSSSGKYVNIYFNGLPPYSTWYYEQGDPNDIAYSAPGSPACQPGPPSGDCYFQVPNDLAEGDWVISVPVSPEPIDGILKNQNSVNGVQDGNDANEYPMGTIGVALNGVHMHNPLAAGDDVIEDEKYGFDLYNAHPDFSNSYHYHSTSKGPLEVLKHKFSNTISNTNPGSAEIELYGITCDGTVIMGCTELNKNSADLSQLDCQNGHVHDIVDENGVTLLSNRYHTHICYDTFTESDNSGNGCEDHEFTPESAYYVSSPSNPSNNVCGAAGSPLEEDAQYNNLSLLENTLPNAYGIVKIYPNPFNPYTNITYELNDFSAIKILIYDISGNQISVLVDGYKSSGTHTINWNAKNYSTGIYFLTMETNEYSVTKKLMFVK